MNVSLELLFLIFVFLVLLLLWTCRYENAKKKRQVKMTNRAESVTELRRVKLSPISIKNSSETLMIEKALVMMNVNKRCYVLLQKAGNTNLFMMDNKGIVIIMKVRSTRDAIICIKFLFIGTMHHIWPYNDYFWNHHECITACCI